MKLNQILKPVFIISFCLTTIVLGQNIKTDDDAKSKRSLRLEENKLNLSEIEKAVVDEINQARNDPQKFITYLMAVKKSIRDKMMIKPDGTRVVMFEGEPAIDDAISDLTARVQINPLAVSDGLTAAAGEQLADLKDDIKLGHRGKDGSLLDARLIKFGSVGAEFAENISYGSKTARDVVLAFIIDDGVKSRAHRKNIFSPQFSQFGIRCGNVQTGEMVCVTEFADRFKAWDKPSGIVKSF